jgi:hypothetical protein
MDGLQKKDPSSQLQAVAAGGASKPVVEVLGVAVQVIPERPRRGPPRPRRAPPPQAGPQPPQEPAHRRRRRLPRRTAATAAHPRPAATNAAVQAHQRRHRPLSTTLARAFTTAGAVLAF